MKRIIILLVLIASVFSGFAQTDIRANRVIADNDLLPPYLDTLTNPSRVGDMRCRPADTSIYMAISMTAPRKWMKLIKLSDLLSVLNGYVQTTRNVNTGLWLLGGGNLGADRTFIVDTSAAAAYLLRRKDSLTATNPLGYVTKTVLSDTAAVIRALITGGLYTNEMAQDAVGGILNSTEFTYDDAGNAISIGAIAMSKITGLVSALAAKQPLDADLTAIAGLAPSESDVMQFKSGNWANRTIAQLKTDLNYTLSDFGGANTALSNLSSVSINASLIPQSAKDLGAAATAWRDLYLYGSGTYGSHFIQAHRYTYCKQDRNNS
jgi:hypothetical protein